MGKKIVIGMSGGVDSSVSAYILKSQGYDVIGVTMQVWHDEGSVTQKDSEGRCGITAVDDAREVAGILGIEHHVLNFKDIFDEKVVKYFINEYLNGKTPNPCIVCNHYVKWEALMKKAKEMGAEYIATGHYAQVLTHPETGRYTIKMPEDASKDQTYVLYRLTQHQLEHTLMPLWNYNKTQVRNIAAEIGLTVADKPDSQEICFISDEEGYVNYIKRNYREDIPEGNFVDINGNVLAKHKGIIHYTVGQRKGLGVTFGKPMFVKAINAKTNEVVLSEHDELFCSRVFVDGINFMGISQLDGEMRVMGKLRYNQKPSPCTIKMNGALIQCDFDEPQRAPTPGQAAVFYDNGCIACGGTIV